MKKLFSFLIVLALALPAVAATLTFSTNNGTISCTKGTSSVTSVTSGSSLSTWTDYTVTVSSPTWTFEKWTVTYGGTTVDVTTSAVTNTRTFTPSTSGTSRILKFSTNSTPSNITIVAHFIDPSALAPVSTQSYTATPGANARVSVGYVSMPSDAVEMGFNYMWCSHNYGESSATSYDGTKRKMWSEILAMTFPDGWRMPVYDQETGFGRITNTTWNSSERKAYSNVAGFTNTYIQFTTSYNYCWAGKTASGSTAYYFNFSSGISTTSTSYSTSNLEFRLVYDPNSVGIYKLTILLVKDGVTTANVYYCAKGQVVNITPATVSGYNSSWTSGASGTGTKTFTVNSNTTATITYTEAISYVTATFNNWDGTQLAQYTNVVSGTQPSYGGSTPTKPATQTESEVTTYTFTGWSPALGNISTNTTYTAQYSSSTTPRTYTIRFLMDDGETVLSSAQVVYNGSPIEPSEPTKIGTEEYSYNFTGWEPAVTAVTGDQDYVAVFEQVAKAPKYDLTIGAFTNGSVTLTANGKTDVVPAAGGTYQYEEGTTIIVKAVPAKGYHFNQWNDANKAASRQVSEIAANMTLTPTFAENTPFLMDDTWEQAAFISNCAAATGVLTVTLKDRTYSAGQWATLSVPFNCTLDQEDELYNAVYKLHTLTLAQDGGSVSFEFIRTNVVEANEPYLIVPRHDISEVIFHGVTLTTPAEVSRTTDDRVTFVSGLWKQTIAGPNEFYVATGNSLRYASSLGTNVKGNRAFFRKIGDAASAPRRAIMVIDGEEVEVEIAGDAIEEVQDVRKYIENGVLIIERNGVRMDAQGKRID